MAGMNRRLILGAGVLGLACAALAVRELACSPAPSAKRAWHDQQGNAERTVPTELSRANLPPEPTANAPSVAAPPRAPESAEPKLEVVAPPMPETGHFKALLRIFEAEPRDSAWASEQEARMPRLLAEAGFSIDAFDRNATCRKTLCRFSLEVDEHSEADMFALMKLAAAVQTSSGLSLAYGAAEAVNDKTRVVVLIPSEGTSLDHPR
jgi:hypothetical protein